jgi:hypothetical protein
VFVANCETMPDGEKGKERPLFADNRRGERVPVKAGTRFIAELAQDVVIDRRGAEPKEVTTGNYHVVTADIDIHPGCLTSCIRTGRAVPVK